MVTKRTRKRRKLKKKADKLWKEAVFGKYGHTCELCGKEADIAHHFFPKERFAHIRYDLDNGIPLCQGCHLEHHRAYSPLVHIRIIDNRGREWLQELILKAEARPKRNLNALGWYREQISKLESLKEE